MWKCEADIEEHELIRSLTAATRVGFLIFPSKYSPILHFLCGKMCWKLEKALSTTTLGGPDKRFQPLTFIYWLSILEIANRVE